MGRERGERTYRARWMYGFTGRWSIMGRGGSGFVGGDALRGTEGGQEGKWTVSWYEIRSLCKALEQ